MNVEGFNLLFALLTIVAIAAVVTFTATAITARTSERAATFRDDLWDRVSEVAIPLAFGVGLTATLGSLYYSEVANFPPCELCWFQRIAMYPMPVLLAVAWHRGDTHVRRYVMPVALIGAAISIYHYQLERFPDQGGFSCAVDNPCTLVWVWMFRFISIPLMALAGFGLIAWLVWIAGQRAEAPARG
ncbi:MAG TPA: disulfide bond formation protein B [Actinomycetota bacterium]|nr:disulfide bond formation protein B [Actinomycetota bacterium]